MNTMAKREGGVGRSIWIWQLIKFADGIDVLMMVVGSLGAAVDGLSTPGVLLTVGGVVNKLGSKNHSMKELDQKIVYFLFLAAGIAVAAFVEAFCWTRTGERQASRMRRKYLMAVLRQDVEFFDMQGIDTAEVVNCVSNDTLVIQDVLSEKVPNFIMNCSTFLGCYGAGLYISWRLTLVSLPFLMLLIIPGSIYGRSLMTIGRKMHSEYNKASSIAEQAVSSIRTVYSFVAEEKVMVKFSSALEGSLKVGIKQGLAKGLAIGANGVTFSIWAFMLWYGSRLIINNGLSGGDVVVTGFSIILGGLSLGTALPNLKHFSEACIAALRIFEMIKRDPQINFEDTTGKVLEKVSGEIELRNVEFVYPSRPDTAVFSDFSLTIPAGQTVALVGSSGSGKSTVISLIERFYDPLAGEVLLDGENIRGLQLKWFRTQIGLVSQEPALLATSIYENLLFGKEDATMEEVISAAKASNAHNFIEQLPDGYHTLVGERGVQMSGGQKQRIAIARAILKHPAILLLDEATSALDAQSEKMVQETLDRASMGRTTVVVAHRLSTVRNADIIAVLHSGRVIETGTHKELIQRLDGAYAALVQLQQASSKEQEQGEETSAGIIPENPSSILSARKNRHGSEGGSSGSGRSIRIHGLRQKEMNEENENTEATKGGASFKRLLAMNAPEWKQAVIGCVGAVGYGAVQATYSFVLGSTIGVLFLNDKDEMTRKVKVYCCVFVGLSVWSFVVNMLQHYNFAVMGELLTRRVRLMMLSKILTFEVGWFDREENSSGALCTKLGKDANVVRSLVADRVSLLTESLAAVVTGCTLGLFIAWRLALVIIALQPLVICCYYTRRVLLKSISKKAVKAQEQGSQVAAEAVVNHRTVTAFCSQQRILNLFESTQEGPRREINRESWYAGLGLGASQTITIFNWAMSFWYGGKLMHQGIISSGAMLKTILILIRTGKVIADAGSMTSDLAKGANAVESVFRILDKDTVISPDDPEGMKPEKLEGNVEMENVLFAYPARPDVTIFSNFCLRIRPGSSVALVGQSGCGKSTIIGLIERFYDPLDGRVKIDNRDIKTFNLRRLRQHIALVGQEPTLFAGSIRDNIVYGKEDATETEVIEAAKAANAHQFVSCLKDGYKTNTGERGLQMSGGQKQRIAIARAIIKNPSILLLDEATSALDAQSEKVVQEALDRVMVGRTSVIVAHRLTTIQNADCIAVIEKGRIVEEGSHSQLLNKGESGAYFSLVKLQQQYSVVSLPLSES